MVKYPQRSFFSVEMWIVEGSIGLYYRNPIVSGSGHQEPQKKKRRGKSYLEKIENFGVNILSFRPVENGVPQHS